MNETNGERAGGPNGPLPEPPAITILNVDDDDDGRHALTQILKRARFQVVEAATGAEALRRAAEQPDLIVLDVNLPDLSGFEVCRRIKSDPATAPIPVLHLSGSLIRSEDRVRGLDSGADAYLTKPVEPLELIAHVKALIRARRAEKALRESEQKLRLIVDNTREAVFAYDMKRRLTYVNPAVEQLTGYTIEELHAQQFINWLHPDDAERMMRLWERVYAGEEYSREEFRLITKQGQLKWCLSSWKPLVDEGGCQVGVQGSERDITPRKRAEESLRESYRLVQAVMEGMIDAVYVKDREGRYRMINSAGARLLGRPIEEVVGKHVSELFTPETARQLTEDDQRIMTTGETQTYEHVATVAGVTRTFLTTKGPHRDEAGNVVGVIGISRDITEHKKLEEQLRQAQKMEAIGRLAGGVAHDFNNLLTAIIGYSDLILMECVNPTQPLYHNAEEIKRAADRAATLTRQLLAYSRQQVLNFRVLNLNSVVADMEKLLRRLIGEDIELLTRLDPQLRRVTADPGQIEQVLMNLAVNARDAMPRGGRLVIVTANVELYEAYAWRNVDVQPGAYVCLAVSDTGCGMTDDVRSHLFEPFFTTKEIGKGTGLGLATIYGIIKQSGGHIEVNSAPGQGATFKVFLPQVLETAKPDTRGPARTRLPSGSETILLVEDDEVVRLMTRSILQRQGYTVLAARHGAEAVQVCEQHPGPIHLLVTDVVMPNLNGRDLYQRLAVLRPAVKVVYISGYPGDALGDLGVLGEGTAFLPKPFPPEVLVRQVRELLDR